MIMRSLRSVFAVAAVLVGLFAAAQPAQASPYFSTTGSMGTARWAPGAAWPLGVWAGATRSSGRVASA